MSDALTDISGSDYIAQMTEQLIESERKFLASPSQENLNQLFQQCDRLSRCRCGYWGENPKSTAESVKTYYQTRFVDSELQIRASDIAMFLNSITESERKIYELANLMAFSQGIDVDEGKNWRKIPDFVTLIKDNISYSQHCKLTSGNLDGYSLDQILTTSGLKERFKLY